MTEILHKKMTEILQKKMTEILQKKAIVSINIKSMCLKLKF